MDKKNRFTTEIPKTTIELQSRAANPRYSAWVSANAGSGKTHVLTERVIRLMLSGVLPSRILCLTYTKSAAANMTNRILALLRTWTVMADHELMQQLQNYEEAHNPHPINPAVARQLFARAIETPGGLKIQTIHSFCESMLHRFSTEADVPHAFRVIDETGAHALRQASIQACLAQASSNDGKLFEAFTHLSQRVSAKTQDELFQDAFLNSAKFRRVFSHYKNIDNIETAIRRIFNLSAEDDVQLVSKEILDGAPWPQSEWKSKAQEFNEANKNLSKHLAEAAIVAGGVNKAKAYMVIFFTTEGKPRAENAILTKKFTKEFPADANLLEREIPRISKLSEKLKAVSLLEDNLSFYRLFELALKIYEAGKVNQGGLDFSDLVDKSLALLGRLDAAWVHYKLDMGNEHILVDEAQDTSDEQWQLIKHLTSEFYSGEGGASPGRTFFAVGDQKQSIFSFQGASPNKFFTMQHDFQRRANQARQDFANVPLQLSFRSCPEIIEAVDMVFQSPSVRREFSVDETVTAHMALRQKDTGRVDVWPIFEGEESAELDPWQAAFIEEESSSSAAKLASQLGSSIEGWLRGAAALPNGEAIEPRDILILVRKRKIVCEAILKELKSRNLPFAGADRLSLMSHLAVQDLMALAQVMLVPQDDLSLASVLKSPLFEHTEEDIFELCHRRNGTIWENLKREGRNAESRFFKTYSRLYNWHGKIDYLKPFEFFEQLLTAQDLRRRFVLYFGEEVNETLDEFLNLALIFEQNNIPSMLGFLSFMRLGNATVKREADSPRNEIRIMTVHGAKGLESKIVILADTIHDAGAGITQRLFMAKDLRGSGNEDIPLFVIRKENHTDITKTLLTNAKMEEKREYWRLLYVAMTRAEDWLIVAGAKTGTKELPKSSWYEGIRDALLPKMVELSESIYPSGALRFQHIDTKELHTQSQILAKDAAIVPDWLFKKPVILPDWREIYNPSRIGEEADHVVFPELKGQSAKEPSAEYARARGTALHRILEVLPTVPSDERISVAEQLLRFHLSHQSEDERAKELQGLCALFADPDIGKLLEKSGMAEVPVVGTLELETSRGKIQEVQVSGQIDRLVEDEENEKIWLLDFKTGAVPPTIAKVPHIYKVQLSIYARLLRKMGEKRVIDSGIIWVDGPRLDVFLGIDDQLNI